MYIYTHVLRLQWSVNDYVIANLPALLYNLQGTLAGLGTKRWQTHEHVYIHKRPTRRIMVILNTNAMWCLIETMLLYALLYQAKQSKYRRSFWSVCDYLHVLCASTHAGYIAENIADFTNSSSTYFFFLQITKCGHLFKYM